MSLHTTHAKIHNRFKAIGKIMTYVSKKEILETENIDTLNGELQAIVDNYTVNTNRILVEYKDATTHQKKELTDEYNIYLTRYNLDSRTSDFVDKLKKEILKVGIEPCEKLNKMFSQCDKPAIEFRTKRVEYDLCSCGATMEMFPNVSELRCRECAEIDVIKGTEFEEHAVTDPNKQKKGDYDPSRFVDIWIDRIQAIREVKFPPPALQAIGDHAKKDGLKNGNEITCEYIRQVWKKTGYTQYNDDAAYARKISTGISPPQFTYKDKRFVKMMVIRIMRIFNQIKDADRSNSLYYAYVIYKVIKQFFSGRREIKLLESIHIQKDDTLVYNDTQYKKICITHNKAYKPHLKYEPTVVEETLF